ncbi:hypothetical protein FF2_037352 [Malus domestica]
MATAPVKSPLHNFPFTFLKWGTKNATANNHNRNRRPASSEPASDPDSEPDRYNHVGSSRADRCRLSLIPCSENERRRSEERESDREEEEAEVLLQKPWNLRSRRALATASFQKASGPNAAAAANREAQEPEGLNRSQSEMMQQQQPKSMRLRGLAEGQSVEKKKKEKSKFWIALSKEEIEEDVFVMTGSRPPRRPKKRPKNVQKQLDSIFPGLWLLGVTADAYKSADSPCKVDLYGDLKIVIFSKLRKWKLLLHLWSGSLNFLRMEVSLAASSSIKKLVQNILQSVTGFTS